eukprot:4034130-Prymnesium_polylepis.1
MPRRMGAAPGHVGSGAESAALLARAVLGHCSDDAALVDEEHVREERLVAIAKLAHERVA